MIQDIDELGLTCWGCGGDYHIMKWEPADLIPMLIYGVMEYVCPDCYEAIPEDAQGGAR